MSEAPSKPSLRELQRRMAEAVMRPLTSRERMQGQAEDGRSMKVVAGEFIKPNKRLTSFERLEIYNRQYWFRLLDCLSEDYPGLRAILGDRKFLTLAEVYLQACPSRSFTLRNLGKRLEGFLQEHPDLTAPRTGACVDMARLEWAHVEAFDSESKTPLRVEDLQGKSPARIRLRLQPHLQLLKLDYPVDSLVLSVKGDQGLRGDASNTMAGGRSRVRSRIARMLRPEKIRLVVHRCDHLVYYKRIDPLQFQLLESLESGLSLQAACVTVLTEASESLAPEVVQGWFRDGSALGWFCRRSRG